MIFKLKDRPYNKKKKLVIFSDKESILFNASNTRFID